MVDDDRGLSYRAQGEAMTRDTTTFAAAWEAFHKLWTAAVNTPEYNKQLWLTVERGIDPHTILNGSSEEENAKLRAPIPMILFCPACNVRHIDVDFATKPHHTHACQSCGVVWRPAIVNTVGVQFLPGFKDPCAVCGEDQRPCLCERTPVRIV